MQLLLVASMIILCSLVWLGSSVRARGAFRILLCKRRVNARELFVTFYLLLVENGIVRDCNNTYNHYPPSLPTPYPMCYIMSVGARTIIAVFFRVIVILSIRECQWLNVSTLKSRAALCKIERARMFLFFPFFFSSVLFLRQNGRNKITEKTTRSTETRTKRKEREKKSRMETLPFGTKREAIASWCDGQGRKVSVPFMQLPH